MQFTFEPGVGPLPLRFGMAREDVERLFATFDIPSAYVHSNISPQNAIGAYPEFDEAGALCCVEFSTRCSVLFNKQEVLDDEADDLALHFSSLFGAGSQMSSGLMYPSANVYATQSGGKVTSVLLFNDAYRLKRFGN